MKILNDINELLEIYNEKIKDPNNNWYFLLDNKRYKIVITKSLTVVSEFEYVDPIKDFNIYCVYIDKLNLVTTDDSIVRRYYLYHTFIEAVTSIQIHLSAKSKEILLRNLIYNNEKEVYMVEIDDIYKSSKMFNFILCNKDKSAMKIIQTYELSSLIDIFKEDTVKFINVKYSNIIKDKEIKEILFYEENKK